MHLSSFLFATAALAGLAFAGPIVERQTPQKLRISEGPGAATHLSDRLLTVTSAARR